MSQYNVLYLNKYFIQCILSQQVSIESILLQHTSAQCIVPQEIFYTMYPVSTSIHRMYPTATYISTMYCTSTSFYTMNPFLSFTNITSYGTQSPKIPCVCIITCDCLQTNFHLLFYFKAMFLCRSMAFIE